MTRTTRAVVLTGGVAAVVGAVRGPVGGAAEGSVAWHMVEHLVLTLVAAPMLAVALPWRTPLDRGSVRHVAAGAVLSLATIGAWHIPWLYDAAVGSDPLHVIEHMTMLTAAAAFWRTLTDPSAHGGLVVVALFLWSLPMIALGAAMTLATHAWYALGPQDSASRLADQQLAGVWMWAVGGLVVLVAAMWSFARWLSRDATIERVATTHVAVRAVDDAAQARG